jgi:hypothetical protein
MSENEPSAHHIRAEEDRVASSKIVAVGLGSLLVFFLASLAAGRALERRRASLLPEGPPAAPSQIGQEKIGIIEQKLFETARTGAEWQEEGRRRLGSYGWIDRKAGIVHVPVDEAMKRLLQGERP